MKAKNYQISKFLAKAAGPIFLLISSAFMLAPASAAVMQVTPVRIDFTAAQQAQSVMILNNGRNNMQAQVRVMQWTQENGKDILIPAKDLVPSPAIMDVAPDKHQTVRLIRLQSTAPTKQLSYRILIDELPLNNAVSNETGVEILLRYSIPVFINPEPNPTITIDKNKLVGVTDLSQVKAQIARDSNGKTQLQIANFSDKAIRVGSLTLSLTNGQQRSLQDGLVGYILPGKQMSWPVDISYPLPASAKLEAQFNEDTQLQVVPISSSNK